LKQQQQHHIDLDEEDKHSEGQVTKRKKKGTEKEEGREQIK
jgi:hypothetical protein